VYVCVFMCVCVGGDRFMLTVVFVYVVVCQLLKHCAENLQLKVRSLVISMFAGCLHRESHVRFGF